MKRRALLGAMALAGLAGCVTDEDGDTDNDDLDNGEGDTEETDWDDTHTFGHVDSLDQVIIGELDTGDQLRLFIEVEQGQHVGIRFENRDLNESVERWHVWRSDQIESYDGGPVSPFETTIQIDSFAEYAIRPVINRDGDQVTVRYIRE